MEPGMGILLPEPPVLNNKDRTKLWAEEERGDKNHVKKRGEHISLSHLRVITNADFLFLFLFLRIFITTIFWAEV